jgi:hypothetical protein
MSTAAFRFQNASRITDYPLDGIISEIENDEHPWRQADVTHIVMGFERSGKTPSDRVRERLNTHIIEYASEFTKEEALLLLLHASLSQSVIKISKETDTNLYATVTRYKLLFLEDDLLKLEGLEAKRLPGIEEMQAAPDNLDSASGVMEKFHEILQMLKTAGNTRVWRDFLQTSRTTGNARVLQDLFQPPRSAIHRESPIAPLNALQAAPANSEIEPAQESRTPTTLVRRDQNVYNGHVTSNEALVDIGGIHIHCSPGCSSVALAATAIVLTSCCVAYSAHRFKIFTPDEIVSDLRTQESNNVKGVFASLRLFCATPEDVSLMCQFEKLVLGEEDKKHGRTSGEARGEEDKKHGSNTTENRTSGEARGETDAEEEQTSGADEEGPQFAHTTERTADTEDLVKTPLEMSSSYVEKAIGVLAPVIKRIYDSPHCTTVVGLIAVAFYFAANSQGGAGDVDAMMRSGAGMEAFMDNGGYAGATRAANKLDIPACAANSSDTP